MSAAQEIADYLDELTQPGDRFDIALETDHGRLVAANRILQIIQNADDAPFIQNHGASGTYLTDDGTLTTYTTDDNALAQRALARLRRFANEFGPDPINDEPDEWAGSAADHAEQLYNILTAVNLHP